MPKWVDAFKKCPTLSGFYYLKIGGRKVVKNLEDLLELVEDSRYDEVLWLDESDEKNRELVQLMTCESVEDFIRLKVPHFSITRLKKLIDWHSANELHDTFRKFYINKITKLEAELRAAKTSPSQCNQSPVQVEKPKPDTLLDKIKMLNKNPYFDVK